MLTDLSHTKRNGLYDFRDLYQLRLVGVDDPASDRANGNNTMGFN